MKTKDIYTQLADHLSALGMGYPPNEDLEEILRANFNLFFLIFSKLTLSEQKRMNGTRYSCEARGSHGGKNECR